MMRLCRKLVITSFFVLVVCIAGAMNEKPESVNVSRHLGIRGRVNLGSFYTPAKYVKQVSAWLLASGISKDWKIADLSCGYGAFFELADVEGLDECIYIGNDIDGEAVAKAREVFPRVHFYQRNALFEISREAYGISDKDKFVVVGNPPYNDVTSQSKQNIKSGASPMDQDVKTRDLGMSSLLAYNKLRADYVAVLHPLSYLIKQANFKAASAFFRNYKLIEHVVFSSQEFAGTSKLAGFPVIVAMYKRDEGKGLTYQDVKQTIFVTTEGERFSLSGFDYVTDVIDKYPGERRYDPEILFYTLRDVNALRRSRTFIKERIRNAIDVDPKKLAYYCYIDCFKRFAEVPYYLGNFNVPYIRSEFESVSNDIVAVSKFYNQDVFGKAVKPTQETEWRVKEYISKSIKGKVEDK